MKTIFVVTLLAFFSILGMANSQIIGVYDGDIEGKIIQLSQPKHGSLQQIETAMLDDKGKFTFDVEIENPGLFVVRVLNAERQNEVRGEQGLKRFYLENGETINIKIKDDSYELLKPKNDKNRLLSDWNHQVDTIFSTGYNTRIDYETYFPLLPDFIKTANAFKKKIRTKDTAFNELMNLLVDTDLNVSALYFLYSMRSKHPTRDMFPEHYNYIISEKAPKSERLLEIPAGADYLRLYTLHTGLTVIGDRKAKSNEFQEIALSRIDNDLLKGYYLLENLRRYRSYDDKYKDFKKTIEPYLLNDYLQNRVEAFEKTIRKFEKGTPAIDFAGTDVDGQEHKLSDYKGGLVYVDVWATWCGPCKAEIPALKEIKKKYHGQSITFLSISVDKPKDREKWKAFVKENELKGVQLIADKTLNSDVTRAYEISSIPRFMLFDANGNIITTDAPRPSDSELLKLLNKYL